MNEAVPSLVPQFVRSSSFSAQSPNSGCDGEKLQ
jgi:hypothetical protein